MDISVVIPTFNRRASLERTLGALASQTLPPACFEVLVIDDHSTDDTWDWLQGHGSVQAFRLPANAGPAAARNVGIQNARGTWLLFLGDDTFPAPDCLDLHLKEHQELNGQNIAVLGSVEWWTARPVTPLMRYLTTGGTVQHFAFHEIQDRDNVPYGYFFTSNVSVNRKFLLEFGVFDEDFRYAYGEDTELAYRLSAHGLRIVYRPHAAVAHDHPTSYASARRRAQNAGSIEILMARKHPELVKLDFLNYARLTRAKIAAERVWTQLILDPFLELADQQRWDHPSLRKLFDRALARHQLWTMLDVYSEESRPPVRAPSASPRRA